MPDWRNWCRKSNSLAPTLNRPDDQNRHRLDSVEASVNELYKRSGRPGAEWSGDTDLRKSAVEYCKAHRALLAESDTTAAPYEPSASEIQTATKAQQGLQQLFRTGSIDRVDPEFKKALSAFQFGNTGLILAPQQSSRVLSCLIDPTDFSSRQHHDQRPEHRIPNRQCRDDGSGVGLRGVVLCE